MIDTQVMLCGKTLKNPIIAASGTFSVGTEFSRVYDLSLLGGVTLKAVTLERRAGNPPPRIAETPSGILNAVGLQNIGAEALIRYALPQLKRFDTLLIANIAGNTAEEYCELAGMFKGDSVDMLELNVSCPNVKSGAQFGSDPQSIREITSRVRERCDKPLIVKLSPNAADIAANARAAQDGGADAVSLINTIAGMAVDARTRRPILKNITGGLSGPAVKPVALRMVYEASRAVAIPVIGAGGVMTGTDVAEFMLCGASAVMVGTANLIEPTACPRIVREFEEYLAAQKTSARDIIGALVT